MNKELAKDLLLFVNTPFNLDNLLRYCAWRIEYHRDQLEQVDTDHDYHRGAIKELRRFATLKDEVLKASGK
jgi:hypothetical protein